jgi:hypothetical protein
MPTCVVYPLDEDSTYNDRLRIVGRGGAALIIARTPWSGLVNGMCITSDRFTITFVSPERVVHYLHRDLLPWDVKALRDLVAAAMVEDNEQRIPAASCESAGFRLSALGVWKDTVDLCASILGYLELDEVVDIDGSYFTVNRLALGEARDVLDRWLVVADDASVEPPDVDGA